MSAPLLALRVEPTEVAELSSTVTGFTLTAIALLIGFFVVRPELWRRLWFDRVDPRPAALMRITFGLVVFITFWDLMFPHPGMPFSAARFLFTDEGLWLTDLARKNYGDDLATLWDPEHGFEHWYDPFKAMWGTFTVLHLRSDPPFVFALFGTMMLALGCMILGIWTRVASIVAFVLVETLYRYSPVFYTGGDTVVRVFLFLGMFSQWGQAYSVDSWRRRKKAILSGQADRLPALRGIPAWPMRLMMLQLTCIYCATGLLKSGTTWSEGTALYYALNLDHFYRFPQSHIVTVAQWTGLLPAMTMFVRWWEALFPLALLGAAVNAYERERRARTWPATPLWRRLAGYGLFAAAWVMGARVLGLCAYVYPFEEALPQLSDQQRLELFTAVGVALPVVAVALYLGMRRWLPRGFDFVRHWVIGKRFWLGFGFLMHIGIDVGMNVGTFAEVMMTVYLAWLSGPEVETGWRFIYGSPRQPRPGPRPARSSRYKQVLMAPIDRQRYGAPRYVVGHHPSEASVRRAALLRIWDLGHRLDFVEDPEVPPERLSLRIEGRAGTLQGDRAAAALTRVLPGLLWLRPLRFVPGAGKLAARVLHQR